MRLSIRAYDVFIQVNLQFSLFIFGRRTTVRPVATQLPFFGLQHPVRDRGMVHGGTAQRTVATTSLIVLCPPHRIKIKRVEVAGYGYSSQWCTEPVFALFDLKQIPVG